ncbi:monosaccharide-transporting ATPase [Clostridia bacterium]|nr:monosaccharide-transporting ATPase [Clostridia bacterium]
MLGSVDTTLAKGSSVSGWKKITQMREFSILMFLIGVIVVMSIVTPNFAKIDTLVNVLYNISTDGIIVIGMTAALICGGFDLSVGAILGFTCATTAQLFLKFHLNIWVAALLSIAIAIGIGAANGFFITKLKLSSFITTLAMMGIVRGAIYVVTKGVTLSVKAADPTFLAIGKGKLFGVIPNLGIICIILVIVFDILMRRSKLFRKVYYSGSSEKAARMSGINTTKVTFGVFVFTAGLAGVCGVLSLMRFSMSAPTLGTGTEMLVISAAVIGGCSLNGGEGSVLGAILGVILLTIVSSSMTLLHVSTFWQQLVTSLILLIAVSVDSISEKAKAKKLMLGS